jgi:hypothetical protein
LVNLLLHWHGLPVGAVHAHHRLYLAFDSAAVLHGTQGGVSSEGSHLVAVIVGLVMYDGYEGVFFFRVDGL